MSDEHVVKHVVEPAVAPVVEPAVAPVVEHVVEHIVVSGGSDWKKRVQELRPIWSAVILIAVFVFSFLRYPHSDLGTFYSTAASVIATLYVAIAISVFATPETPGSKMTLEHWVFIIASSAGLLASLRGLSVGSVHHIWQIKLLTSLTVVGITAAILLVAERLVTWRGGVGNPKAVIWTVLFIAVAIALAIFP